MNNGKVSIIIPVHNAGKFIVETILSVKSQTFKNWELILVDDFSTDKSRELIKGYVSDQIRLVEISKPKGAACARNIGLDEANGQYICFLDADDLWDPQKLELQIKFMEDHHCGFSFTSYEYAGSDGIGVEKIVRVPAKLTYRQALKNTTIFTSTVMFDITKIPLGLIHMPEVPSEDTATWWQILRNGYTAYGFQPALTLYRRSEGTLSSNKFIAIKRIWNLYRDIERLNLIYSIYCFCFYAFHAVWRRI